jgi:hypothetical protein
MRRGSLGRQGDGVNYMKTSISIGECCGAEGGRLVTDLSCVATGECVIMQYLWI